MDVRLDRCLPLPMTANNARLIRLGLKTQTRRLVTGSALTWLQPGMFDAEFVASPANLHSRYGYAGDTCWIREPWRTLKQFDKVAPRDMPQDTPYSLDADSAQFDGRLRPAMFMPRWMSATTVRLDAVRVERLQDISEDDAEAEGVEAQVFDIGKLWRDYTDPEGRDVVSLRCHSARESYASLWDWLHGAGSWDTNPWVWVYSFTMLEPVLTPLRNDVPRASA